MGDKPVFPHAIKGATALFVALCASTLASAQVAVTPPGTLIVNIATVSHSGSNGPPGTTVTIQSNAVVTEVAAAPSLDVQKSVTLPGTALPGSSITFRMIVENPAAFDLTSVRIVDALDPWLGAPTAMTSGDVARTDPAAPPGATVTVLASYDSLSRTAEWDIGTVPAGARFELSLTVPIDPATPDDTVIRNRTRQTSDQDPAGSESNEAVVVVLSPVLTISKTATRDRAEVGDPIGFTVEVANLSPTVTLTGARVKDLLPDGLRYLEGSARLDGGAIADPPDTAGALVFDIGDFPPGARKKLTYGVVATPEAENRERVNQAYAEAAAPSGATLTAGPASASVSVSRSLLSSEAVVAGRVFVDDNRNGLFDSGEAGVPAARVYLEDGTFVLTDVVGKYHIEGVRPGLHVVKVDPVTLPDGLGSQVAGSRSAGGSGTLFADVEADQLYKSNVATAGWGLSVARLRARAVYAGKDGALDTQIDFPPLLASAVFEADSDAIRRTGAPIVAGYAALIRERGGRMVEMEVFATHHPVEDTELMASRATRLRAEIARQVLAAGPKRPAGVSPAIAGATGGTVPYEPASPGAEGGAEGEVAPAASDLDALEARVREMTPEPALLMPIEGDPVRSERGVVEFKLAAGVSPRLKVNGEVVPEAQIAVRMETSVTRIVFYRYIGVPFQEGRNSIVVEGTDGEGNVRAWLERIVDRTGPPAELSMAVDDRGVTADGRTAPELRIQVTDALGHPVADGTSVTVESETGEFIGKDASAQEEGFQVLTRDGIASVRLSPAAKLESREVIARSGPAEGTLAIALGPHLRDWIVAGVGEASAGTKGLGGGDDVNEILDDGSGADGRLALFARGRLFGASLMTLAYDSGRERDRDQVFRRVVPDRYFPIYGDSSEQGFDVEGQGKFSLRLDQPRSSFTVGDFTTGLRGGDLLAYNRALTGGSGRADLSRFSIQSFAATTPQSQVRDELPGSGLSGPYRLSKRPIVVNSELVVLETRDRFHPEQLIASRPLSRYVDYDVDAESGTLLFRQPIPYQDDSFNPIVVVVRYEALDGSGDEPVAGGRVGLKLGSMGEMGATYVSESRGSGSWVLRGTDLKLRRTFGRSALEFGGEAGTTTSVTGDTEGAYAFRASGSIGPAVGIAASWRRVGETFDNASRTGLADAGTTRWGIDVTAKLPANSALRGEIFSQSDSLTGTERRVRAVEWQKIFERLEARAGAKDLSSTSPLTGEMEDSRAVTAGAKMRLSERLEATAFRQQIVSGASLPDYPTRTAAGLQWRMTDAVSGFVREEFDQTDLGTASRSIVGLESRLGEHTVAESRYSLEDALSGARGMAQMGIRTRLPLNQDWMGNAGIERVATARGISTGDFTSLGLGAEYLPAKSRFTTRYELRLGETDDQHVVTTAGARRLTDNLSLFARQRFFFVSPETGDARFDGDGLVGLAFRPVDDDRLNFLVKFQGVKGAGATSAGTPTARTYLGVFETNYQPIGRLHLLGRVAVREGQDELEGADLESRLWLAELRGLYDISARFNAGLSLRHLDQNSEGTATAGLGIEMGYRAARDLWVVSGWNFTGFTEEGFGDTERRESGPFVSLRFKFDEETLAGIGDILRQR